MVELSAIMARKTGCGGADACWFELHIAGDQAVQMHCVDYTRAENEERAEKWLG